MKNVYKKYRVLGASILSMIMLAGLLLAGCGDTGLMAREEPFQEKVELAIVEWPGVTQKTYVVAEVLEELGYDTTINNYSLPVILQGMSDGDIDAFTGTWFQTWGTPLNNALEENRVVHVSTQLDETNYGPAVPSYVYEAGVKSMEDLSDYADKFNYTYYGLEAGNDGNEIMIEAFANNTYNLGEWNIMETNTAAMLADIERKMDREEWIVFSGWEPHWMNVILDMEYLDDPEGIWGGDEAVGTIVRTGLQENDPNLYLFFEQFDINSDIQNEWIYEYSKLGRDTKVVANEWIENNLDLVLEWVDGMYNIDGEDAQEIIRSAYNG